MDIVGYNRALGYNIFPTVTKLGQIIFVEIIVVLPHYNLPFYEEKQINMVHFYRFYCGYICRIYAQHELDKSLQ